MASRLPTVFMNHGGGPLPILGDPSHAELTTSLKTFTSRLNLTSTLQAILVISAHWEAPSFQVLTSPSHSIPVPLFYDYYGFPQESYKLNYSPPGSPQLARRVVSLLTAAGLPSAETRIGKSIEQGEREGYDHGVFIPLLLSFPEAKIPVVQLSLKKGLSPEEHIACGQALAPLREEGVLLYGSGMSYHNMRYLRGGASGNQDSVVFDEWLNRTLSDQKSGRRLEHLAQWEERAPHHVGRRCHPREEHFAPLFVVAGAAGNDTPCLNTFSGELLGKRVSNFAFQDDIEEETVNDFST